MILIRKDNQQKVKKIFPMSLFASVIFSFSAFLGLLLSACSSLPAPTEKIQLAEAAISHAEVVQAADYISPELTEARQKLTAARAAIARDDMVVAQQLAEQSALDADLAAAKAGTVKAKVVNDEMKKSTTTLKQEMQRNQGSQP